MDWLVDAYTQLALRYLYVEDNADARDGSTM